MNATELKAKLEEHGYDEVILFENPDFAEAFIGVTSDSDHRAVYDHEKMITSLMVSDEMTYEDAAEFIDYNTIRSLGYVDGSPIIVHLIPGEVDL